MRDRFPQLLEDARGAYYAGDKSQLWDVICFCALFQATVPDWAVDALFEAREGLARGSIADMNDVFGPIAEGTATSRARRAHLDQIRGEVIVGLQRYRAEGGTLNRAEMFEEVANRLRTHGSKVRGKKDVEAIYKEFGGEAATKGVNKGSLQNFARLEARISCDGLFGLRSFKCTGRPLFADDWPRIACPA